MSRRADLFCRVVDNYGDIGVCWRLARQLVQQHGWQVRLWVDDLVSFARIEPRLDTQALTQHLGQVEVVRWTHPAPDLAPLDVVIEAFACDPPPAYLHRMQDRVRPPIWLNLEYLSAEDWAEQCHGLPSPQPGGLVKYFFFPGFSQTSGGLLRDPTLTDERDRVQRDPRVRAAVLADLGLPASAADSRLVTLFCYPDAPASVLVEALAGDARRPTLLTVPAGVAGHLATGTHGNLTLVRLPFVTQPDYDRLLWCADLNFVRGEDSFVRAQLAGRPMVWHIYPQEQAAHVDKLSAWLSRYAPPAPVADVNLGWNGETGSTSLATSLRQSLAAPAFDAWTAHAQAWAATLSSQSDLSTRLTRFCDVIGQKRD